MSNTELKNEWYEEEFALLRHLPLYPLRGPCIVAVVLTPWILKRALQLPAITILSGLFLIIGVILTFHDGMLFLKEKFRRQCNETLKYIVLDDVLRNIFDPQIGFIAAVVSLVVGNASVYSLNLTQEDRIRLLQSCLWTTKQDAQELLMAPGGIRLLLPDAIQQWLQPKWIIKKDKDQPIRTENDKNREENLVDAVSQEGSFATQSTQEELQLMDDFEPRNVTATVKKAEEEVLNNKKFHENKSRETSSIDLSRDIIPTDLFTVITSIFKDKLLNKLKYSIAPLAISALPSALALIIMLRKKKPRNVYATLLSVAAGATFLNCYNPKLMKRIKRVQTVVSFFVFCYFSKKHLQTQGNYN
mmetsp:Transcript_27117/g.41027  ORF Transcript_27117/g.41027 Transcript_27117/m.41027 type:complete len:359 (-) Transcript_27117:223-1299(-)